MNVLIEPHYLPCFHVFKKLYQAEQILLDIHGTYQKQCYQHRTYIATPQGLGKLIIPIQHKTRHRYFKDVCIDYTTAWHKKHPHALSTAYGQSPYYSVLWDMLRPIYEAKPRYLYTFCLATLKTCFAFLQITKKITLTTQPLEATPSHWIDLRHVFHPKRTMDIAPIPYYPQRFESIQAEQLSVFDLLCSQGTYAHSLLSKEADE